VLNKLLKIGTKHVKDKNTDIFYICRDADILTNEAITRSWRALSKNKDYRIEI